MLGFVCGPLERSKRTYQPDERRKADHALSARPSFRRG